jgi:putative ABC transport system permease protein
MALRERRAGWRKLLVLTAAVAVGVAALVAIDAFTDNLRDSVRDQARGLLGADLALQSRQPFSPAVVALIDTLHGLTETALPRGVQTSRRPATPSMARTTEFSAMAYVPRTSGTRLVQVTATEPGFPYYGYFETEPRESWAAMQEPGAMPATVVEPALLTQLNARVGDTLALGDGRFRIIGVATRVPGDVGVRAAFGARVYIPFASVAKTGLLGFGARAEHAAYFKLPASVNANEIATTYRPKLRAERVRIRTVDDDRNNLTETLERLASYLGLVALIALLLGGLGVASAVSVFIRRKLDSIAVLRCLGATSKQVFAVYLLQALAMGALGGVVGVLAGLAVQQLLPGLLREFLPVSVSARPSLRAVLLGLGIGLWVSAAFALLPLLQVLQVTPLAALRRDVEPGGTRRDPFVLPTALLLVVSLVLLAALQVRDWALALWFSGSILVVLGVLWLASWGLTRAVRRWFPTSWSYVWRQGLANLYRPANQTVTVVLSLGFGAFLLSTLYLVQYNLLRQLRITGGADRPNLVLFDVQTDQLGGVDSLLAAEKLPRVGPVPIVPMRIRAINSTPVLRTIADTLGPEEGQERPDSAPRRAGWAVRREYRSTYRDTLVASEKLTAGNWWTPGRGDAGTPRRQDASTAGRQDALTPGRPEAQRPGSISIELGLASELDVTIGDTITWDVQGVALTTVIRSMREVDWARFEPNFFVVFEPGLLEEAPQSALLLTRVADGAERGRVQRILVERFSNVTSVDISSVQQAVEQLVGQVTLAIRFMALFSLLTGAVVLIGAVATSRYQRLREGALLRTLGGTRAQIFRIVAAEYTALGLLAALVGVGLSAIAAWALARWVFELPFGIPAELGVLVVVVVAGTALVGLVNSRDVVRRAPLEVLRAE